MLTEKNKEEIISLWEAYIASDCTVKDLKGIAYTAQEFDDRRIKAIHDIKKMIADYLQGKTDIKSFKSSLDGYNKRNNHWGFAAMKGQMFFNQLANSSASDLKSLDKTIKEVISQPSSIKEAKKKISTLEDYIDKVAVDISDKQKIPKRGSVSYFLSYFWQIENPEQFPILYTSLVKAFDKIGLWKEFESYADEYEYFYDTLLSIQDFLSTKLKRKISQWDMEHCFWLSVTSQGVISPAKKAAIKKPVDKEQAPQVQVESSGFELYEYIPPIVADLIEAGSQNGDTKAIKGSVFEKKVATLFRMLDFEMENLGQGKGREPDGVIMNRRENTAFIYDAKVREAGYSIGTNDRAFKEYVNKHYPKLVSQGYKKIGFLVISTSFSGNAEDVIREITLETDIKRFALVTSEALLGLLAFKLKDGISLADISGFLLDNGVLTFNDVKEKFSDV